MDVLFSIVIPLYNKEEYIGRAISSILNQTYENFEIVIVNDGSTDQSVRKVQEFSDIRIRLITQKNLGISVARNTGISHAKNSFIAFIDADDYWEKQYLESIVELIKKFPEAGMYATGYRLHYKDYSYDKILSSQDGEEQYLVKNYFKKVAAGKWGIHTSSVVIKKKIINLLSGFPIGISVPRKRMLYIIRASGEILCKVKSSITNTSEGVPICSSDKIKLPDDLIMYKNLRIVNIYGEDSYLWDYIALYYPVAYCSNILSNYAGSVPDQATRKSITEACSMTINNLYEQLKNKEKVKKTNIVKKYMKKTLFCKILATIQGRTYGDLIECLEANHADTLMPVFNYLAHQRMLYPVTYLYILWKRYRESRKLIGFIPKRLAMKLIFGKVSYCD